MKLQYKHTIYACFTGYIVQAIVNNFLPLLFLTLQDSYSLSLAQITSLITINFTVQLAVDLIAVRYVDRIGYRPSIVLAHVMAALGFIALTLLPEWLPIPYAGILIAVVIYAIGGGLLEVLVSPIMEACPTDNKEQAMSLLHSFYCWGQVGVVLFSTVFFSLFGITHWRIAAMLWALIPIVNAVIFTKVPIAPLLSDEEKAMPLRRLAGQKTFWLLLLLMVCAGACELGMSQWASAFAEKGLHVSKTIGDLAGPMCFAVLMGTARLLYGKFGDRIDLVSFMTASGILCAGMYLLTALSPSPVLSLIGCSICGFSVGILWPGTFSIAASSMKQGGTALFALLALAGDVGCSAGPTVIGWMTQLCGGSLNRGMLIGLVFPLLLLAGLYGFQKSHNK